MGYPQEESEQYQRDRERLRVSFYSFIAILAVLVLLVLYLLIKSFI